MGLSANLYRNIPDLLFLCLTMAAHAGFYRQTRRAGSGPVVSGAIVCSAVWVGFSIAFSTNQVAAILPVGDWKYWLRGAGYLWALASLGTYCVYLLLRPIERQFVPARREFMDTARTALLVSPAILTGYGVVAGRTRFEVKVVDIAIKGLQPDLNGIRILQLSDIHMSPFLSEQDLIRVIGMANETKPHLCVVTGDLISARGDPLDVCMKHLAGVKADAGILGCNGNHEVFAGCEDYVKAKGALLGMNFLRREQTQLAFGDARMNVVGVDYQQFRRPYLIGMEDFVDPAAFNLLLSHNPDVFPVAARQGFQLTLSGHTHGGQVTVEILRQYANVARIFTPYVSGHYRKENSELYVTRGIGTVGIPARLGATPEITLVRLCAS